MSKKKGEAMPLRFGRTVVPHFTRALGNKQRQLTRHPYLNYLSCFKSKYPTYGFGRIMSEGAAAWKRLLPHERACYSQKEFLKYVRRRSHFSDHFDIFPHQQVPFDFERRSMRASKNINRSWRKWHLVPHRNMRRMPQIMQIDPDDMYF